MSNFLRRNFLLATFLSGHKKISLDLFELLNRSALKKGKEKGAFFKYGRVRSNKHELDDDDDDDVDDDDDLPRYDANTDVGRVDRVCTVPS